ncbi:hypothetical protein PTKIN_Ptkin03bG0028700 [Pterospermum kingtungense]
MAQLKNLERDYPIIDSNFQQFCVSHGIFSGRLFFRNFIQRKLIKFNFFPFFFFSILVLLIIPLCDLNPFSVEDFLIHDLYTLAAFAEQSISSERLKEGITQVLSIMDEMMHQPWQNGLELLEDAKRNKHLLPTGIEGIDLLLGGGVRVGQLTELVGPSSSGKTQVCLQTASNVARNYTVLYLDTGNSFSPQRIAHFLGKTNELVSAQAKDQILQKVMSNILCRSVFDIFAMFDVLHQLQYRLLYQVSSN